MKRAVIILAVALSLGGCTAFKVETDVEELELIQSADTTGRKVPLNKGIHIIPQMPNV